MAEAGCEQMIQGLDAQSRERGGRGDSGFEWLERSRESLEASRVSRGLESLWRSRESPEASRGLGRREVSMNDVA
eukprot:1339240-Amorphochlora_amoeboformis.AAC.1